jgi:hypothetical protein
MLSTCYIALEAQELSEARAVIEAAIQQPDKALVFLRPGRLVRIREGALDWGWGVVCSVSRRPGTDGLAAPASHYMLDTLLATAAGSMKGVCLCVPNAVCDAQCAAAPLSDGLPPEQCDVWLQS